MQKATPNVADVLGSMADAVITINAAKKVASMNPVAQVILGITEAEAPGKSCSAKIIFEFK